MADSDHDLLLELVGEVKNLRGEIGALDRHVTNEFAARDKALELTVAVGKARQAFYVALLGAAAILIGATLALLR